MLSLIIWICKFIWFFFTMRWLLSFLCHHKIQIFAKFFLYLPLKHRFDECIFMCICLFLWDSISINMYVYMIWIFNKSKSQSKYWFYCHHASYFFPYKYTFSLNLLVVWRVWIISDKILDILTALTLKIHIFSSFELIDK